MSYILDALRRADRERSRGQLPDLLAAGADLPETRGRTPGRRRAWPWLVAGLAAGLLLALAMRVGWLGGGPSATVASPPSPPPAAPAAPAPIQVAPAPAVPAAALAAASAAPFLPPPPEPARAVAPVTAAVPAKAPASAPAVLAFRTLPEDIRRALPQPKFSGVIHSPVAANRLVIVDGQVAREGDTVAPGLVLEQIRPRSVVLRHPLAHYEIEL
jgi:general secretion pathway protein B